MIADLGAVQSLRAHLEHLAALAGTVTSSADAISDIVPACIPPLVAAAVSAVEDVQGALSAASSVVTAVQ